MPVLWPHPPTYKLCLKRPLKQYWFLSLKCYSDWQLGAIEIELTALKLRFTEDSTKQLMINQLFGGISMIRLIGGGNVSYFLAKNSKIIYFYEKLKKSFDNMTF